MITFVTVKGTVTVLDKKTGATEAAKPGMKLDPKGVYEIRSAKESGAHLVDDNGKPLELKASSCLYIPGGGIGKHDRGFAGSVKMFAGAKWFWLGEKTMGKERFKEMEEKKWEKEEAEVSRASGPGVRG